MRVAAHGGLIHADRAKKFLNALAAALAGRAGTSVRAAFPGRLPVTLAPAAAPVVVTRVR